MEDDRVLNILTSLAQGSDPETGPSGEKRVTDGATVTTESCAPASRGRRRTGGR